jgi:hypothetical protein
LAQVGAIAGDADIGDVDIGGADIEDADRGDTDIKADFGDADIGDDIISPLFFSCLKLFRQGISLHFSGTGTCCCNIWDRGSP